MASVASSRTLNPDRGDAASVAASTEEASETQQGAGEGEQVVGRARGASDALLPQRRALRRRTGNAGPAGSDGGSAADVDSEWQEAQGLESGMVPETAPEDMPPPDSPAEPSSPAASVAQYVLRPHPPRCAPLTPCVSLLPLRAGVLAGRSAHGPSMEVLSRRSGR